MDVLSVRRIVTGLDDQGRSVVLYDGAPTNALGDTHVQIWSTEGMPVDNAGGADLARTDMRLDVAPGGTRFWIARYPAGFGVDPAGHPGIAEAIMAIGGLADPQHPAMHSTVTIDYIVLLEGELTMILDAGEVTLKPFDCLVQRGTSHRWENRTDRDAVFALVLAEAVPLESLAAKTQRRAS